MEWNGTSESVSDNDLFAVQRKKEERREEGREKVGGRLFILGRCVKERPVIVSLTSIGPIVLKGCPH